MHTKNANNCCVRTVCSDDFSCVVYYIIWLWLVICILLSIFRFVFCQRVPFGFGGSSGNCEKRPASYLTFHVQFSINCIWIALKRYVCFERLNASANNAFQESLFWNEWMNELAGSGWWTKSQFFSEQQQKLVQKECTRARYLILYIHCCYRKCWKCRRTRCDILWIVSCTLLDHLFTVRRAAIQWCVFLLAVCFHHFLIPFMPKDGIVNNTEFFIGYTSQNTSSLRSDISNIYTWPRPKWYA